jgi:hypothetical protein
MNAVDREKAEREVVERQNDGIRGAHAKALILLSLCVGTAPLAFERFSYSGFVAVYAVSVAAWLVVRRATLPFRHVVVIALILRALLAFREPMLSGDVYRYLWDGHAGRITNPYRHAPADRVPELAARPWWYSRINHPEIRTIYPPHAQLLFLGIFNLTMWRALLIACDLLTLFLLRRHPHALLAFATFPPLLFEGVWSGHIEVVAATLLTLAAFKDSPVAAAIASGLKVTPLAALPALVAQSKRRPRFIAIFAVTLLLPVIAYALAGPLMPGFRDYATRWIFNSPLYSLVFALVEPIPLKAAWTAIKDPLHLEVISDFVYRHIYADFVTRAVMAAIALTLIVRNRKSVVRSVAALLICAPAIHPWYWLAIAPLAIAGGSAWLYVALAAPASYLLYDGAPPWTVWLLCYGAPLVMHRFSGAPPPSAVPDRTEETPPGAAALH